MSLHRSSEALGAGGREPALAAPSAAMESIGDGQQSAPAEAVQTQASPACLTAEGAQQTKTASDMKLGVQADGQQAALPGASASVPNAAGAGAAASAIASAAIPMNGHGAPPAAEPAHANGQTGQTSQAGGAAASLVEGNSAAPKPAGMDLASKEGVKDREGRRSRDKEKRGGRDEKRKRGSKEREGSRKPSRDGRDGKSSGREHHKSREKGKEQKGGSRKEDGKDKDKRRTRSRSKSRGAQACTASVPPVAAAPPRRCSGGPARGPPRRRPPAGLRALPARQPAAQAPLRRRPPGRQPAAPPGATTGPRGTAATRRRRMGPTGPATGAACRRAGYSPPRRWPPYESRPHRPPVRGGSRSPPPGATIYGRNPTTGSPPVRPRPQRAAVAAAPWERALPAAATEATPRESAPAASKAWGARSGWDAVGAEPARSAAPVRCRLGFSLFQVVAAPPPCVIKGGAPF